MPSSRRTSSPGCPGRRRRCWRARTGCGRRRGSQRGVEWWPWRFRLMRGGFKMIKSFAALAALALSAWLQGASAQDYPAREIRAICNYAAGSGADLIVRFYSDQLSRLAGKPVIVENKPGAQGMVANEFVARSRPDGLTILITPVSSTVNLAPSLFRQLSYDPQKDFAAVTTLATVSKSFCGSYERSEEHTSELQSLAYLVCRLLLEKKKNRAIMFSNFPCS